MKFSHIGPHIQNFCISMFYTTFVSLICLYINGYILLEPNEYIHMIVSNSGCSTSCDIDDIFTLVYQHKV